MEEKNKMNDINKDIHYLGEHLTNRRNQNGLITSMDKKIYYKEHKEELIKYRRAVVVLNQKYGKAEFPTMKELKDEKDIVRRKVNMLEKQKKILFAQKRALDVVVKNVEKTISNNREQKIDSSTRKHSQKDKSFGERG